MCLITIEPFDMISILAPVWRQVHGAIVEKPPVSVTQLTVLTISHHTPPLENQVRHSNFSFAIFTWFLGLSHKNRFLPTNMKPQHWLTHCCFESPLRALHCRCHIHCSWRNWHPTNHFYMVQAVCQLWNQSRVKHVKSIFGLLQSNYAIDINECTWEGNNERINAYILLCVLIVQAYYA
jgi:hypothetical protein